MYEPVILKCVWCGGLCAELCVRVLVGTVQVAAEWLVHGAQVPSI